MNIVSISKLTSSMRITVATTVIAALVALPARLAWSATDAEQAEVLIHEGVRLRARDQTARALPVFEEAYAIWRSPRTAAQLGLCELELGSYLAAERHLAEALASPDHPWIARNKSTLKRQLDAAAAKIGELALTVSPANAEVLLNKKPVDRTLLGAPLRLDKGPVEVEVRAPGYQPLHQSITIVAGERAQLALALVPESASPGAAATALDASQPSPGGAEPVAGPSASVVLDAASASPRGASRARIAAWIVGGTALAALAFGTAEAFNAADKRDAFNDHTGVLGGNAYQDCATADLSPACKPLKDAYSHALTLSIVGFVAAGALAATSSVLFVLSSPNHQGGREEAAPRALACVPDIGIWGFGCAFRF